MPRSLEDSRSPSLPPKLFAFSFGRLVLAVG
jgi:hypothetical protein